MVMIISNYPKKTKGRQKIEIKPIQRKSNLQVTFSKRRAGLIKKASELSLLCGAHVALLTFSPGNKVFTYGHSTVDSVIDHYLNQTTPDDHRDQSEDRAIQRWNEEYVKAVKDLEDEKKCLAMISENNNHDLGFWWENNNNSIINDDNLGLEELEDYLMTLKELKRNVDIRLNELMIIMANNNHHHLFGFNYHHHNHHPSFGLGNHVDSSVYEFGEGNF